MHFSKMHFRKMHFRKMHFLKILQIFGRLVLGCIKTKFCNKICARQHFSSSTRFASFCTAAISKFSQKISLKNCEFRKISENFRKFWQILLITLKYFLKKNVILELCKGVHCVNLDESFQTHIYLQNLASIQPRTSPLKFVGSREKNAIGSREMQNRCSAKGRLQP